MNTSRQSTYMPFPLFLAAALFILASPVFWTGVEAPGKDRAGLVRGNEYLYQEIAPTMHYGFGRLRAGELPLWNDRQLCGVPFFANPVHGLLQPLNIGFLFLDTPHALALHAFMALALMGFFFVLFMRSLGVLYIPATLGGILYMCCGATAAAMSRPNIANALVWMPLLIWMVRAYIRAPRLTTLCAGSVILSLLWLSGSSLAAFVVTGFCGVYAGCHIMFGTAADNDFASYSPKTGVARVGGLLTMLFLAAAITAIQWLPSLAWAVHLNSPLEHLGRFRVAGVMPANLRMLLAQMLQAGSGVLPALGYVGMSTLLLLPAAFLHATPRWERAFFAIAAVTLWTVALFSGSGLPEGLWAVLIYPATFSVAVLAALGADRLFAPRRNTASPRLWGPMALVAAFLLVLFVIAPAETRGRMVPLAVALFVFALFRTRWASAVSGIILVLFLFVDLNEASNNHYSHPSFDSGAGVALPANIDVLVQNTALDDRILVSGSPTAGLHANIGMSHSFRVANGAGYPFTPAQKQWWQALQGDNEVLDNRLDVSSDTPYGHLLNVMAVRAALVTANGGLASGSAPGLRLRRKGDFENIVLYENENAIPRVSWASSWRMAPDISAALEALGEKDFDPRQECIVLLDESATSHLIRTVPDNDPSASSPEAAETRIATQTETPERIMVEVKNAAPGILVISDTYDPGWRATVNGQRVPILKTNGLFRGIALAAGEHTVTFEYRPLSVIAGAAISAVAIIIVGLALLIHCINSIQKIKRDHLRKSV